MQRKLDYQGADVRRRWAERRPWQDALVLVALILIAIVVLCVVLIATSGSGLWEWLDPDTTWTP